jgi:RHS repeat-associated protein
MLVFAGAHLRAETTVYVGKHFEVRDHDAPVKYVFNGNTRVARVTGSLSTNERIQRLRLRAGWNLVSLAVTAPDFLNQLREFTSGPAPVIQALNRWQPATSDYGAISSGENVAAGTVLWIPAQVDLIVPVRGGYVETTEWRAPAAGTFVAVPALEAQPLRLPAGVTVWRYDAPNRRWQVGLAGDLGSLSELPATLAPGEAIYVHSNEPTDLGAPSPEERIRYYHQDHLGSSSAMTDANGALVEESAFYPFGIPRHEHRLDQVEEPYKFTQKERDRESGLHYFEARHLSATLSRFASVDPQYSGVPPVGDPQQLNLYAYVHNSPLHYRDPTGLDVFDAVWIPGRDSIDELDLDETFNSIDNLTSGGGPFKILAGAAEGIVDAGLSGIGDLIGINTANAPGFRSDGKPVTTYPSLSNYDYAKNVALNLGISKGIGIIAGRAGKVTTATTGEGGGSFGGGLSTTVAGTEAGTAATGGANASVSGGSARGIVRGGADRTASGGAYGNTVSSALADTLPGATATFGGMTRNQMDWIQRVAKSTGLAEAKMAAHAAGDQAAMDRISACWEVLFSNAKYIK